MESSDLLFLVAPLLKSYFIILERKHITNQKFLSGETFITPSEKSKYGYSQAILLSLHFLYLFAVDLSE